MLKKFLKFTFKKQTWEIWDIYSITDIKYQGNEVGYIQETDDRKWIIRIQIPASAEVLEKNPNCKWVWGRVKKLFDTETEARNWINDNRETVIKNMYFED